MNSGKNHLDHSPGIGLVDIYFVVFRRKWLILLFTVIGVAAGLYVFFTKQPPYQSSAKLLIKYIQDTSPTGSGESGQRVLSMSDQVQSVLNSEMQILTSLDIFQIVATNVTPEKILAKNGGGTDANVAADIITQGTKVEPSRESSVIQITFRNNDQMLVSQVVSAIIDAYLDKHLTIHNTIGISEDLLTEKAVQLRQQIANTDAELHMAKTNAGVVDVFAEQKAYADEISRIRRELLMAQADYAERRASINELAGTKKTAVDTNQNLAPAAPLDQKISDEVSTRYKALCSRLVYLQKKQSEYVLLHGYTEENALVKEVREQIASAAKLKNQMEEAYPALSSIEVTEAATMASTRSDSSDAGTTARLTSLPTRIKTLESQLREVQAAADRLGDAEQKISELMSRKKIQESAYDNIQGTLQRMGINQVMGPGRVSGIQMIQRPSLPFRDFKSFYKKIGILMFGGFGFGLVLAFILEFYLDRSIKRPIEVQTKLKIPFFLSIPDLNQGLSRKALAVSNSNRKLLGGSTGQSSAGGAVAVRETPLEVMSWEVNRRFNSYYDALRDRLVVYFESINLTRKPKLVAVTSTHKGAGVSTIAAGLAQSLSETGDGRVLLVDMNLENGAAQQFFKGKPNCKLDDALESDTRDGALVQENLYVVTEDTVTDRLPRVLPKRFASLIPKLKASDYDYIIFDMPPVSPTSVTARLSGFMDTVMLVIESEKTDQQVVQQANALLAQSKANVTAILNKTKTYIPKKLHQDFLSEP
jgi:uncharacterized protein involved in exopolysaccharide biosynthesis/Mrp family chromosome partitioning ATPase